jgi:predicted transcriptional regulator
MDDLKDVTTQIVSAYVETNTLSASDLPDLIRSVYRTLSGVGEPVADAAPPPAKLTAAQIRKSITPDYLVSLEDGRRFKSMKRHLGLLGLSPEQYRAKWGLPKSYPMVAPSYSAARSALAKSIGLGAKGRKPAAIAKAVRKARPKKTIAPGAT